ncbi:hypothetical protein MTO96_025496 [Rhipicephalus appendiculatus]
MATSRTLAVSRASATRTTANTILRRRLSLWESPAAGASPTSTANSSVNDVVFSSLPPVPAGVLFEAPLFHWALPQSPEARVDLDPDLPPSGFSLAAAHPSNLVTLAKRHHATRPRSFTARPSHRLPTLRRSTPVVVPLGCRGGCGTSEASLSLAAVVLVARVLAPPASSGVTPVLVVLAGLRFRLYGRSPLLDVFRVAGSSASCGSRRSCHGLSRWDHRM